LKNNGTTTVNLSGCYFSQANTDIVYAFPTTGPGSTLDPGKFMLLVSDPVNFAAKYPSVGANTNVSFIDVYFGHLKNGGIDLDIVDTNGNTVVKVNFDSDFPWPPAASGLGYSLVPIDPNFTGGENDPTVWRASTNVDGSPGTDDPAPT